jgi:2-methylcitrate dehydratase
MNSVTRQMAKFTLQLTYKDLPDAVLHEARRFLLDSLGCAFAALNNEDMRAAHRFIEKLGGAEHATVLGTGWRTNAPQAALMNSLLIRAIDYNDIYWKQDPSHPSDIIPAAMAAAEANYKSVREMLVGVVIAYELEMRWCLAATPGVRERGWHHASLTQFVSPFVAGRLLDLTEDQMVAAAGISGSSHFTLGGVVAGHLTNMKNTADPMAVEAGVAAALLAREGYSGPEEVIEGKEGLIQVLHNVQWSKETLLKDLGSSFLITECGYKPFPTEALTHQPITAALQVKNDHRLQESDINQVLVQTTTRGADILSDPSKYHPTTKETADHSLPYCIAAALVDGNVLPSSFAEERLTDPRIRAMLNKIKVVADPDIDAMFPGVKRAIVSITTADGHVHSAQVDNAKGSPEMPMSDAEVIAKFRGNAATVLSATQQEEIINETMQLGKSEGNAAGFMQRLIVQP